MSNASELYIEGDGRNFSMDGVLLPRDNGDSWLPFDAALVIESGVALPSRQLVALGNGRGFKWVMTSMGYGDVIATDQLTTANWADSDDKSEVNVVYNGENYIVSKDEDSYDFSSTEDSHCWLIKSEGGDLELSICIPRFGGLFPKTEFTELFNAANGCPELAPKSARSRIRLTSVPLPLRKWYASYNA
eukprot:jgi/Phyca11/552225/estExt2_Genewise1Plus.C_PHYCAscaffold_470015